MSRAFRPSTLLLGVLLGLVLSFTWVFAWGQEMASAYPLDLPTAAQTLAVVGGFSLVASSLPDVEVWLPYEIPSGSAYAVLSLLAAEHNLSLCRLKSGVAVLGARAVCSDPPARVPGADLGIIERPSLPESTPEAAPEESPAAEAYTLRFRTLEINDERAASVGVALRPAVASLLGLVAGGAFGTADLLDTIQQLERDGVSRSLDDVRVTVSTGRPFDFRAGGSLTVNLVGQESIQQTIPYGLGFSGTLARSGDSLTLTLTADLSTPVNTSDVQLLNITSRAISTEFAVQPGQSVVFGSLLSLRDELSESADSSELGAAGGASSSKRTIVLTVDLLPLEVGHE